MLIKNIKDKSVDSLLNIKGISHATVFYSPISFWIIFLFMIISSGIGLFYSVIVSKYIYLIISYIIVSYLLSAYLNNSFALTSDKLIVINPNIPFRQFKTYNRQEIKNITIDKNRLSWFTFFAVFGGNYITIETKENLYFKYYCISLEEDSYDGNWTHETIDTFNSHLKEKGYSVKFNIDK